METSKLIALFLGIALVFVCILGAYQESQYKEAESDLCYSLKTNQVFLDDNFKRVGITEENTKLQGLLDEIKNRHWMGC